MNAILFVFLVISSEFAITVSLRLLQWPPLDCSQKGLRCSTHINTCSNEGWEKPRLEAPVGPLWGSEPEVTVRRDESGDLVPVLSLSWRLQSDGGVLELRGTEVHVLEMSTNKSLCVRYIFLNNIMRVMNPEDRPWSFSLDRVEVNPGMKYLVSVSNLPKPDRGNYIQDKIVPVKASKDLANDVASYPGCKDPKIQGCRVCVENGSLWEPNLTWSVSGSGGHELTIVLSFSTGEFSQKYQISIKSPDIHLSQTVWKGNQTSLNVTFTLDVWPLTQCNMSFVIKPFHVRCMNDCVDYQQLFAVCSYFPLTSRDRRVWIVVGVLGLLMVGCLALHGHSHNGASPDISARPGPSNECECIQVKEQRKVLIIYSLDHPLYKEVVLNLCAFLRAKCGTEVMLDLLDSTWLSTIGGIQWLDMQREQVSKSSDRILILCSKGVWAKWRAMCGETRVTLREDVRSPVGDMLTPALSLIVPDLVRAASFQKYMVAYFQDVCREEDVPSPFNVTVKYKLMEHFEELFFRLLDREKHAPGRVNYIEGVAGDDYFNCPSGLGLRAAIQAFRAHQLENPSWFEEELVGSAEGETAEPNQEHSPFSDTIYNPIGQCEIKCKDGPPVHINDVISQSRGPSINEMYPVVCPELTQVGQMSLLSPRADICPSTYEGEQQYLIADAVWQSPPAPIGKSHYLQGGSVAEGCYQVDN